MSDIEDEKEIVSDASLEEDENEISDHESISIIDDDIDNDLEFENLEELEEEIENSKKNIKTNSVVQDNEYENISDDEQEDEYDEDDDDDEDDVDDYNKRFEKLDKELIHNHIENYHTLCKHHNYQEIATLSLVVRNEKQEIVDPNHKTIPILTKYEKARVLGQRAKQINNGADIFVVPKKETFDGYLIALQELEEKKMPFIIRRPLPNGKSEYWKISDLEYLHEIV